MNFDAAYAQLTPEQKVAVDGTEGPMMVLAGPGTGKTQIIALRIAQILRKTQMAPQNILCLTFTESGVVAMRKRLLEMIGSTSYYIRIHTFHSFCNEIIQENPEKFLFARELSPLTDVERVQLFHEILDELPADIAIKPFADPYLYLRDITGSIQSLKREDISPEAFNETLAAIEEMLRNHQDAIETFVAINGNVLKEIDVNEIQNRLAGTVFSPIFDDFDLSDKKQRTALKSEIKDIFMDLKNNLPKQKALLDVYKIYQKKLQKKGRYDFEDMVLFVVRKFKEDSQLLARYQEQFQYILVDEYQDTNGAQNEVVQLLGAYFESPNIFVVGDDKQSIYRFQGASLENMVYFYHLYKKSVQLISLKSNFRSQQSILNASHSLIQHSENLLSKTIPELSDELISAVAHPKLPIQVGEFENQGTERYFIAKKVEALLSQNVKPSEIAVIYRNHRDATQLAELFLRLSIPFRIMAGNDILENKEISKLLGLLRTIQDYSDEHQLFYILNYDFLGFGPLEIAKLSIKANREKKGLFEAMLGSEIFATFAEKLSQWTSMSINLPLVEFFDRLLKESGYLDFILAKENKLEHLNRLNTLFDELKKLNYANPQMRLKDFIDILDVLKENDLHLSEHELATQKDAVRLLTAHKSKGLEFEHVFIIQCTDKHWGNVPAHDKLKLPPTLLKLPTHIEKNEEERRLFYVAITRAKKTVTITYAKTNDNQRPVMPSLFLQEIAPEFMQNIETVEFENDAFNHLSTIFFEVPKTPSDEEKEFIQSLLENYTLSVTHLNNYLRCPRLFYYNNVLRVPRAKSNSEAFGTAIHETLKDWLLHENQIDANNLIEKFEHHLKREILSQQDFSGSLQIGKKTLTDYFEHYKDSHNENVLVEYDFKSHGVHVDGIPITGKLDKIEILDEATKTVNTVDYKTGNPDTKSSALGPEGEYRRQIIFYQLLCDLSPKFPYKMVSGEIDFVQKSKKANQFIKKNFTVSEEEITNLKTQIHEVYTDIKSLKFLNPDEWTTCGECEWCKNAKSG